MKTLVSLISDQSIPNLLFLRQMPEHDRYLFITTKQMEDKGRREDLIRIAGLKDDQVDTVEVLPESLSDVVGKLAAMNMPANFAYTINLTGGNKIMALGAYRFFTERNSEMFYAPIGKNGFEKIFPSGNEPLITFSHAVSLHDYLSIYGIQITNLPEINKLSQPVGLSQDFFNKQWVTQHVFPKLHSSIIQYKKDNFNKSPSQINISDIVGLSGALAQFGFFPRNRSFIDIAEISYLSGGWFEEFVYSKIKSELNLPDDQIGLNVEVSQKGSLNECDVMFIYNNSLYVVECKSRLTKKMFDQTAYKLTAVKKDFGLQARSYLFSSENYRDWKGDTPESAQKRASHLDIQIRERDDILNNKIL